MAPDKPDDEFEPDPPDDKRAGIVPDIVRRAVLTGVGALFMTEEGIRNMVGDMKLPKDALAFLVAQADRTRGEVTRVVSQEVRRFLESETLRRELWKVLTSVTLEVKASIQLKPSGEPEIRATFKPRKAAVPGKPRDESKPDSAGGSDDEPDDKAP